jgi:RNA-directed DNA polymerase
MRSVRRYLADVLKLIVNEAKSQVVKLAEASFLGFKIVRGKVLWTAKSQKKFKAKVKAITKRTRGRSPKSVIEELQSYLRGSVNYYQLGILFGEARELDGWLRRRIRLYYWKQWGRPRTRRRKLLSLGIGRHEVHMASRSRKGHWRMSHNSLVQRALINGWLAKQGVPSLERLWVCERQFCMPLVAKIAFPSRIHVLLLR